MTSLLKGWPQSSSAVLCSPSPEEQLCPALPSATCPARAAGSSHRPHTEPTQTPHRPHTAGLAAPAQPHPASSSAAVLPPHHPNSPFPLKPLSETHNSMTTAFPALIGSRKILQFHSPLPPLSHPEYCELVCQ